MYLSPQLTKKVTLTAALYIGAYCCVQFFLPFGLVLLPLDTVDGTFKSVGWLVMGIGGWAFVAKRADAAQLWALVFLLAGTYSGINLLRFGVECVLLASARCETLPPSTLRISIIGFASAAYLMLGLILLILAKKKRVKRPAYF